MGYMDKDVICSDSNILIPEITPYHFGILESNVHMAWMRVVCGRLKSDYRYSNTIVYNNFPWPNPTDEQKAKIEQTAQAILDARALYPDSSLADLYDELTMPVELRKAHQDNDRAGQRPRSDGSLRLRRENNDRKPVCGRALQAVPGTNKIKQFYYACSSAYWMQRASRPMSAMWAG